MRVACDACLAAHNRAQVCVCCSLSALSACLLQQHQHLVREARQQSCGQHLAPLACCLLLGSVAAQLHCEHRLPAMGASHGHMVAGGCAAQQRVAAHSPPAGGVVAVTALVCILLRGRCLHVSALHASVVGGRERPCTCPQQWAMGAVLGAHPCGTHTQPVSCHLFFPAVPRVCPLVACWGEGGCGRLQAQPS
jgi:hypothetical protein